MKTTKYALAVALGLVALVAPRPAHADIVVVNLSNLTFNGNNACPPSGTDLCQQTLSASFQWDNSTTSYVVGSFSFTTSGALGTSFSLTQPPAVGSFFGSPVVNVTLSDPQTDNLILQFSTSAGQLSPGSYTLISTQVVPPAPLTLSAILGCPIITSDLCNTVYYPIFGPPPFSQRGAVASSGQVSVTVVPESPTSIMLAGGLLCLMGVTFFRKRLV